ncbi:MAG: hypothetical protein Q8Q20_02475 [bacterium]|nr:hypothetical protein [bacterium]
MRKYGFLYILPIIVVIFIGLLLFIPVIYSVSFTPSALKGDLLRIFDSTTVEIKHVEFQVGTEGGGAGLSGASLEQAISEIEDHWLEVNAEFTHAQSRDEMEEFYGQEATERFFNELEHNRTLAENEGLRYPKAHVQGNLFTLIRLVYNHSQVSFVTFDVCRNILIRVLPLQSCGS